MLIKTCNNCNRDYPATREYFDGNKTGKYGLEAKCKPCNREYKREWAKINKDKVMEDKHKSIDPSGSLKSLIVDIILNAPIIDKNTLSISEKFKNQDDDTTEVLCTNLEDMSKLEKKISKYLDIKFGEIEERIERLEKIFNGFAAGSEASKNSASRDF
jgi:hypothetical protein